MYSTRDSCLLRAPIRRRPVLPTPPGCPAMRRPDPTRQWYVRVLDSTCFSSPPRRQLQIGAFSSQSWNWLWPTPVGRIPLFCGEPRNLDTRANHAYLDTTTNLYLLNFPTIAFVNFQAAFSAPENDQNVHLQLMKHILKNTVFRSRSRFAPMATDAFSVILVHVFSETFKNIRLKLVFGSTRTINAISIRLLTTAI